MTVLTENVINKGDQYTQAEAALCVWKCAHSAGGGARGNLYDWLRGGEGAAQARQNCIEIAHFVEHAYLVGNDSRDALTRWSFDWDVVPVIMQAFMGRCPGGPNEITADIAVEVGHITVITMEVCNDTH